MASALPPVPWRSALRRARRLAAVWWVLAALFAATAAARVTDAAGAAAAARAEWGESVDVVVAARALGVGAVVTGADVVVEPRPRAVAPDGAVVDPPVGRVVVAPIVAGEVVVESRLAPDGLRGVAALLPPGHRAVAVPTDTGMGSASPDVRVGDRVDVLATFDVVDDTGRGDPAGAVAEGVTVVAVDDTTVTVAVPRADAPRVAFAAARGTVALAIIGAD